MPFPFEVTFDQLQSDLDTYVDAVFRCLESEFLVMPKGEGFVEFPVFENGYEALKRATGSFRNVTPDKVIAELNETVSRISDLYRDLATKGLYPATPRVVSP